MTIVPYAWMKDHWTLPYDTVSYIWRKMVEEGTDKIVFFTGSITQEKSFHRFLQNPNNSVMTQWVGNDIVFLGWLNNFISHSAYFHFICFKKIWGKRSREAMKNAAKYWFGFKRENGEPLLSTLIGVISEDNPLALNVGVKCGAHFIGTIPNYAKNIYTGNMVGANICYIERNEVRKWAT